MRSARHTRALPLLALLLAACGGGDGGGGATAPPAPVATATTIELSKTADTLRALGETVSLQATIRDQFGNVMPSAAAPTWTSSTAAVASVVGGTVTALSNGATIIIAQSGSLAAVAQILVQQRPAAVIPTAGNGQTGPSGQPLPQPITARVEDSRGSGIPGAVVGWSVTSGGGTLSQVQAIADSSGRASARWTLGPGTGSQSVWVLSGEVSTTFSATSVPPSNPLSVTAISPAVLEEGQQALVSGTGLQGASVLVGNVPAQVLSSSSNSLTFRVPVGECRPSRSETVRVRQGTQEAVRPVTVRPANLIAPLAFGNIWMSFGTGPQGHCLNLEAQGANVRYLVGVQSLSESEAALTPASLRILSSTAAAQTPMGGRSLLRAGSVDAAQTGLDSRILDVTPALTPATAPGTPLDRQTWTPPSREDRDHARAHAEHMERNLALLDQLRPRMAGAQARLEGQTEVSLATLGQTVFLRVPDGCTAFQSITGTVRAVGTRAIWVEDNARPAGGFTSQQYAQLASLYDGTIGNRLDQLLGSPTDFDGNGRVVIVVTPEVNKRDNLLGFVATGDLFPPSLCASSNDGEYFYVLAPDPSGITPRRVTVSDLLSMYPPLLAHELTHVVHIGRQLMTPGNSSLPVTWEAEGFATLIEQLVGHAFTGLGSGQNLGLSAVQQGQDWYFPMFSDLAGYYGFQSPTGRVLSAPHECSWLSRPPNGPCQDGGRLPYGVPASIFRWIADQAWTPATESQMTRAVVNSTQHGLPLLATLAGEDLQWVMARWAIGLATDGLYFGSGGPTFSSWNLHEIFSAFPATARLTPTQASYNYFAPFNVRGGSIAYFTVNGSHSEIAIAAANLPPTMRLWIVRVQ